MRRLRQIVAFALSIVPVGLLLTSPCLATDCGCERRECGPATHHHHHHYRHHCGRSHNCAPPVGMIVQSAPVMSAPLMAAPMMSYAPMAMAPVQYSYAPAAAPAAAPSNTCASGGASSAPSEDAMVKLLLALRDIPSSASAPRAPAAPADRSLEDRMTALEQRLQAIDQDLSAVLRMQAEDIKKLKAAAGK